MGVAGEEIGHIIQADDLGKAREVNECPFLCSHGAAS